MDILGPPLEATAPEVPPSSYLAWSNHLGSFQIQTPPPHYHRRAPDDSGQRRVPGTGMFQSSWAILIVQPELGTIVLMAPLPNPLKDLKGYKDMVSCQ